MSFMAYLLKSAFIISLSCVCAVHSPVDFNKVNI